MSTEVDDLFTLRNHFWLGHYAQAVAEGAGLGRLPENLRVERDEFIYRSYVALGQFAIVLNEVKEDAPVALQAVKLLARYLSQPEAREMVLITLSEWLGDPASGNNPALQLAAATIYLHEDDTRSALRAIHNGITMEQIALLATVYLRMDRVDLAQKQLRVMQAADEDAALTQLTAARVHVASGGKHYQEAAYIYDELIDKHQGSALLLNGLAVAKLHMGEWAEAEAALVEASGKGPQGDADTLINLVCCYRHMDKPTSFVDRYLAQLKATHPTHPYVLALSHAENAFSRVAATFAV